MLEISVQTACWYQENDPDASLRLIKECGFEALDFNIDNRLPGKKILDGSLTEFFDQSIEELCEYYRPLKEALEKYGIGIAQMHAPFPLWVKDADQTNEYLVMAMEKTLAVAAYLGCPAVVAHPITRSTKEKEFACNMALYRTFMPFAKKYGVKICLENLFTSYKGHVLEGACASAAEACKYIDILNEEAGEECFGFCFDVGHANLIGRNIREYLNILGKRLTILHIHDNNGESDLHMIPYTKPNNIDWEAFIEGLRDIDYRGALNFETFAAHAAFPAEVKPEALKLISSIGRYFKSRILTPKEEQNNA